MMLSLTESYDEDFDLAAADKHSLWLPQPPVPDTEASESRGMPDFKHPDGEHLPGDPKARKQIPLHSGLVAYFPDALIAIAAVSWAGNEQHNPGQPLHWARSKSKDHADTMLRHFAERGTFDTDGTRHSAKMVWRALAILQMELEAAGAPLARGAKGLKVNRQIADSQSL